MNRTKVKQIALWRVPMNTYFKHNGVKLYKFRAKCGIETNGTVHKLADNTLVVPVPDQSIPAAERA